MDFQDNGDTETADGTLDNNGDDRLSGTGSETDEYKRVSRL